MKDSTALELSCLIGRVAKQDNLTERERETLWRISLMMVGFTLQAVDSRVKQLKEL